MPLLLEAKALTKHYGVNIALEPVNFSVPPGITGLLGPNGAGKSTVIKLFLGLIRSTSGSGELMGVKPYDSLEIRECLGICRSTRRSTDSKPEVSSLSWPPAGLLTVLVASAWRHWPVRP